MRTSRALFVVAGLVISTMAFAQKPVAPALRGQASTAVAVPAANSSTLLQVRRVFVAPFTGDAGAAQIRELVISALQGSGLFVLTDNAERADAVLKGAASDAAFSEYYQSTRSTRATDSVSVRNGGYTSNSRSLGYGGSNGEDKATRATERKHEAYAAVHLCNSEGDVIWSTTKQSPGSRVRFARVDVADLIAKQLTADLTRMRQSMYDASLAPELRRRP